MVDASDYLVANQTLWDEWAEIHAESPWYSVEAIRAGACNLRGYELEEVGSVSGKRMLHLMCQIGTDSVGWAQRGAEVLGIDFSPRAVEIANKLASELGVTASFVCADVLALPDVLSSENQFDVVYTTRGIIRWIPDLTRWGQVISHFLKPGGFVYVAEVHPVAKALSDDKTDTQLRLGGPYFPRSEPLALSVKGTYAEPNASVASSEKYLWPHSMGEVITALAQAGLRIDFLHEYPWADRPYPFLTPANDKTWVWPADAKGELPMFFTLKATKLEQANR